MPRKGYLQWPHGETLAIIDWFEMRDHRGRFYNLAKWNGKGGWTRTQCTEELIKIPELSRKPGLTLKKLNTKVYSLFRTYIDLRPQVERATGMIPDGSGGMIPRAERVKERFRYYDELDAILGSQEFPKPTINRQSLRSSSKAKKSKRLTSNRERHSKPSTGSSSSGAPLPDPQPLVIKIEDDGEGVIAKKDKGGIKTNVRIPTKASIAAPITRDATKPTVADRREQLLMESDLEEKKIRRLGLEIMLERERRMA
jgi:hypothetical protein